MLTPGSREAPHKLGLSPARVFAPDPDARFTAFTSPVTTCGEHGEFRCTPDASPAGSPGVDEGDVSD